jgi:hypothetical protein
MNVIIYFESDFDVLDFRRYLKEHKIDVPEFTKKELINPDPTQEGSRNLLDALIIRLSLELMSLFLITLMLYLKIKWGDVTASLQTPEKTRVEIGFSKKCEEEIIKKEIDEHTESIKRKSDSTMSFFMTKTKK